MAHPLRVPGSFDGSLRGPRPRVIITERDIILAAAGVLSAILYFAVLNRPLTGGGEPVSVAESLVKHGRFADPFAANGTTGATAHLAPLFTMLLAGWYRLLGDRAIFALVPCAAIAQGVHAALLPRMSERVLARSRPGIIAAVCAIALPVFSIEPVWENMYSGTALLAFCVAFAVAPPQLAHAVKFGLAAGILTLLSPSLIFVMICWVVYVFCTSWPGFRSFMRLGGTASVACFLVLLPWEIRNFHELGGVTFVRDNFGLELYVANNDCAKVSLIENLRSGCYQTMHPIFSAKELNDMRRLGELNYNRDRTLQALRWISQHPARFWELVRGRFMFFWFPPGNSFITLITVLSLAGLGFAISARSGLSWFAIAALGIYSLPYYVVQSSERFRYPVMWISLLLAGYALDLALKKEIPQQLC